MRRDEILCLVLGGGRGTAAQRRQIDVPLGIDANAADFLKGRVEQQKRLARAIHPKQASRTFRACEQLPRSLERQRNDMRGLRCAEHRALAVGRDLVNQPFFTGAGVQIPLRVERQAPFDPDMPVGGSRRHRNLTS